jgi:hypothetical protein
MSLRINSDFNGVTDPDAGAYIAAVEAADGQLLEFGVGKAINDFVVGCKQDRIWDAIKASCILAGARTLSGALVPLAGTAPTNVGPFVSGDYNRKTGLVGDGTSKSLNAGVSYQAYGVDSLVHTSVYVSTAASGTYLGVNAQNGIANSNAYIRSGGAVYSASTNGFIGISLPATLTASVRYNSATVVGSVASTSSVTTVIGVFARSGTVPSSRSAARLAFYSIGESLDLALLDARVTALITAFGVAIP